MAKKERAALLDINKKAELIMITASQEKRGFLNFLLQIMSETGLDKLT